MPTTPIGTTHASSSPNRAPTAALATRSPMSTKPPIAVRIPRVRARTFFTSLASSAVRRQERLQHVDVVVERRGHSDERLQLAAPRRDADVGDVILGVVDDRAEVAAHLVGAVVGRLD